MRGPYEKIVKGYEYAPDQYVVLTREELAELDPKKTRAIEIQDFVDLDDIDPIYFEQPYYLGPDKGAAKAYALLVQAMKESRKVAVALPAAQRAPRRDPADGRRPHPRDDALPRRGELPRTSTARSSRTRSRRSPTSASSRWRSS